MIVRLKRKSIVFQFPASPLISVPRIMWRFPALHKILTSSANKHIPNKFEMLLLRSNMEANNWIHVKPDALGFSYSASMNKLWWDSHSWIPTRHAIHIPPWMLLSAQSQFWNITLLIYGIVSGEERVNRLHFRCCWWSQLMVFTLGKITLDFFH